MNDFSRYRKATQLVHAGAQRSGFGEMSEALFLTQGFAYESPEQAERRFKEEEAGYVYSRYGNPNMTMLQDRVAAYEGGEAALATASGMAAVSLTMLALLKAGDHVVASRALFGGCRFVIDTLLPRFGVETTLINGTSLDAWQGAMRPQTKVLFLETPSNPTLELIDIEAVAAIGHAGGARLVVDNVFSSPCYQRPLSLGADVVVYSATKHMDGHGRCLGGILIGSQAFVHEEALPLLKQMGPTLSPFNAWVILKGLETLELRVDRATDNAQVLVDDLARRSDLDRLIYPHHPTHPHFALAKRQMRRGSMMIAFSLGTRARAFRFLNALRLIKLSNNLADNKSLITHPATTTHQRLSDAERAELDIDEGLVRLSVGIEDVNDLRDDLEGAFASLD